MEITASLQRELRLRHYLRRFAKVKAIGAGLAGSLILVALGPVIGSAKAAGAPYVDEVGMLLLALGLGCLLMSGLAVVETARLARTLPLAGLAPADAAGRADAPRRKTLEAA